MPKKKAKLPLSKTHPKLAKEAYGWDPSEFTSGSNKKLQWKCSLEHIWASKISHRTSGSNCPYCYGRYAWPGFNDLATTHPELAKRLVGTDPTTTTYSSHKKLTWKCDYGHIWEARLNVKTKSGCPYCANLKVLQGFNDLATTHPELAKELVDADPKKIIGGSTKKYQWKCSANHFWEISSAARLAGDGCPFCSGRLAIKGVNDLGTIDPDLASELVDTDPSTIKRNSGKKFKWRCKNGHIFIAKAYSRKIDSGCPYCTNKRVLEGFNDLFTKFPEIAEEAFGWDPRKVLPGTSSIKKWKCVNKHIWSTSPNSRTSMESGCPSCNSGGYDPNKKGYLYFLTHSSWGMLQIGITNFPENRLLIHYKLGWELLEIRGPMDGHLTQQWETAILRMLKAKGADLSNSKIAGKFDGYSEAWSKSTFPVKSIKELMRLTEEFEERK